MDNTKEKNNFKDALLLRMGLNDNKAGMEGLDKEKINKIITYRKIMVFKILHMEH